jgi:phosphohistidine phosphatase
MRHASAGAAPAGGEDIDRGLTVAGRAEAARVGRALAAAGLAPARALVSAAIRTRETWEAMAPAFSGARAQFGDSLYHADSGRLLALVEAQAGQDSDETVMILGHNSGVHLAAVQLLERASAAPSTIARVTRAFPAATAIAFVVDAAGRLEYDGLYLASDLAKGLGGMTGT